MQLTPDSVNRAVLDLWSGAEQECLEISPTHALARYDVSHVSMRPGGFIPGPSQFAIADSCLWYLVFGALDCIEPMAVTSELSIRYLRPGVGTVLHARATLDKRGRRSVVGTVRIWAGDDEARPCSTAQGTYMLPNA
ncbi:MAG: PaaI family thioesterase [Chromatiales bacterium]|jgi:acyl-coenzyme A thioesterase PaaI-like protein|nr:PaaI family thioesterase [Chromatiales bacterium]